MNYIALINSFWDSATTNPLSTGQVSLYFALLHVCNRSNWTEWFQAPNQVLSVLTGMSRSGILKARNELKQRGLIDFRERGTKATIYCITMSNSKQVSEQDGVQNSVRNSEQDGVQNSVRNSEQDGVQNGSTLYKQKEKQNIEKSTSDEVPEKSDAFSDQITTIRELYNSVCGSYPRLVKMSEARKKAIRARLRAGYTVDDFRRLFEMAEASDFLKGRNRRNWSATFDWLIADANMAKVLDGNYNHPAKESGYHSAGGQSGTPNRFHNFEERQTDYDAMMMQEWGGDDRA